MFKVGIDTIAFYSSGYYLDLAQLAKERNIDADKYYVGLGQRKMAVASPDEDVVTLAANAGLQALKGVDKESIEMLMFATESGIDQSKAAGIFVHDLLNLPERCRVVELKQACYSGTIGLQLAVAFLRQFPKKKVLWIASDIARYGLGTPGESSQGCGAVAMILSAEPRILALESEYGVVTDNVMDFWRPNYSDEAFVEGKYSSKLYLTMLEKSWTQYRQLSQRDFKDHAYFCYHTPVPRLVEKAHQHLLKMTGTLPSASHSSEADVNTALKYSRDVGNSYTASLYVALTALLDLVTADLADQRIGFYSYGSGCVAEYFSGVVQPGYRAMLNTVYHQHWLAERTELSYSEYEAFYTYSYPRDGSRQEMPKKTKGHFRLAAMDSHKRIYEKVD